MVSPSSFFLFLCCTSCSPACGVVRSQTAPPQLKHVTGLKWSKRAESRKRRRVRGEVRGEVNHHVKKNKKKQTKKQEKKESKIERLSMSLSFSLRSSLPLWLLAVAQRNSLVASVNITFRITAPEPPCVDLTQFLGPRCVACGSNG